jgi:hypothetical protein
VSALAREDAISRTRLATQKVRQRIDEALRNAALEDYATSARVHLGLAPAGPTPPVPPTPDPTASDPVRPLGRPHEFVGEAPGRLVWTSLDDAGAPERGVVWGLAGVAALATVVAGLIGWNPGAPRWVGRAALAAVLTLAAVLAGPLGLAAGLGTALLGRLAPTGFREP